MDDKTLIAKRVAMELRPGSTTLNVAPPDKNVSPAFIEASGRIMAVLVELGLPEG